jgi:hypothetical protein
MRGDMSTNGESKRQLGELLVLHRVVTPEQLAVALERQRATGQQLGRIVVELGFAPGPIVAQALATQRGGLVKTEYGFATGWGQKREAASPESRPRDVVSELADRDRVIAELREWVPHAQTAIASRDAAIKQLQAQLSRQTNTAASSAELVARAEVEQLQVELAERVDEAAQLRTALARLRADAALRQDAHERATPPREVARVVWTREATELALAASLGATLGNVLLGALGAFLGASAGVALRHCGSLIHRPD